MPKCQLSACLDGELGSYATEFSYNALEAFVVMRFMGNEYGPPYAITGIAVRDVHKQRGPFVGTA